MYECEGLEGTNCLKGHCFGYPIPEKKCCLYCEKMVRKKCRVICSVAKSIIDGIVLDRIC